MRVLVHTNDVVLISFVGHLLDEVGIAHVTFDAGMSVLEGSIGILPRRIMVDEGRWLAAVRVLEEAGLGGEIAAEGR
jgi:hypothetical protein